MTYDLVIVGTGFATSFFLHEFLAHAPASARVLVLERGARSTRAELLARRGTPPQEPSTFRRAGSEHKTWTFTLGFGGGSRCWWGCAPRLLPSDFRLRAAYGAGDDWPITYDELEPWLEAAEQIMAISGGTAPYPRRIPHPQPPHRLSDPDRTLAAAYPGLYVPQPTARARLPTGSRGACCANGVCGLCPVDAKFTIENGMASAYADPRVTVSTGTLVRSVDTSAGRATGVVLDNGAIERGDLVALGAGALFNAAILLGSSLPHRLLGRRLFEQVSVSAFVELDGIDNFQGSTVITGQGYMLYDGEHRRERGACLIESWNRPDELRWEQGRERQLLQLKCIVEDLPQERNRVTLGPDGLPVLEFHDYSTYAQKTMAALPSDLERVLAPLPVERIVVAETPAPTEGHILGTVVMGNDPATSVVDRFMVHHAVRNLLVLGGSAFPTGSPTHPTLTIAALSMWSAAHLMRSDA
jgi:choline dehydrogenase-like flavoprotein